jgi:PBSX family phage terminase large subunit
MYIAEAPPGKLLMSGRTKESLKANVLDDLFAIVGSSNYIYRESTGDLWINGRYIKCIGADKIDSEAKIRGQTYAGWYGDEITIQHKQFVKQAIARCSAPGAKIFWTTNPDHPKHHINTDFIQNMELRNAGMVGVWHFLLEDNKTLTQDYIELLKGSNKGIFYQRNILGLWVIAEGVVYGNDYNPNIHRLPVKQVWDMVVAGKFKEYIAGTDWGYSHPMTGLLIGVTPKNEYYLLSEFYKKEAKTEDLAAWYIKMQGNLDKPIRVIFCDSAEPDRIITLRAAGLPARAADKEINAGINSVQVAFANNRLFIADNCNSTDTELQTYRYPDEDDAKAKKDQPLDEDNHAMDGLRYAVHNYEKHILAAFRKDEKRTKRQEAREAAREAAKIKQSTTRRR